MKKLLVCFVLFALAIPASAQFVAIIGCYDSILRQNCDPNSPTLDLTCYATIMWDQNNNGPDPLDAPPVVGDGFGQCNFNRIPLSSGPDLLGIPGGLATDPAFTISTTTPQPSHYYLVVDCQGVRWVSAMFTINDGLNDIDVTNGWSCMVIPPECDEPTFYIHPFPFEGQAPYNYACVPLCAGIPVEIAVGPLPPHLMPMVTVFPGCLHSMDACNQECPPAQFEFDPSMMVYNAAEQLWCYFIMPITDGCVCVYEFIWPVEYGAFAAVAGDRSAEINWSTASERDIDFFRLLRDGVQVCTMEGTNTSSGANYSYRDENLQNGRTYCYTLEVVNVNGSVDSWPTETNVTPSPNAVAISEYALHQNYPNPFNPITNIVYDLVEENHVLLTVYDVMGREVARIVDGTVSAGRHTAFFDASRLSSGVYFYTVKIGDDFSATKKMLLVR